MASKVAVTCIKCMDETAVVCLDLDASCEFRCMGCRASFTTEDVQAVIDSVKKWEKIITWLDGYPTDDEPTPGFTA